MRGSHLIFPALIVATSSTLVVEAFAPPAPVMMRRSHHHQAHDARPTFIVAPIPTRLLDAFSSNEDAPYKSIGKPEMEEIIQDLEEAGADSCGYCVLDVRGPEEVSETGPLSNAAYNLPLPKILEEGVLKLSEEDFQAKCGFPKPSSDSTIVFSCKAGKRAEKAAAKAKQDGYDNVVVYSGSANEWFGS
jgi:rhodanese-related sulfurtransferase